MNATPSNSHHLTAAVTAMLERQLRGCEVAYCWPEAHRVRIRTADGRVGDVEVVVNWDVVPTESAAAVAS